MHKTNIQTLDLNFQGYAQAIASYMIPHSDGVVLVESGPGSTLENLEKALGEHGYGLNDVTHVLLTHIHLDHAGAAGALARRGATICVHPVGAPHMLRPEKLIASATRIYGEDMDRLWGTFLPVPADRLRVVEDEEEIVIGALHFVAFSTPGHAEHHHTYCLDGVCFTGDIGGVRLPGPPYLRLPMPPPELHLEKWRRSVQRLRALRPRRLAPTHFGIYDDPDWHLQAIESFLDEVDAWLRELMPAGPDVDEIRERFVAWQDAQGRENGIPDPLLETYEIANPSWMSAAGMLRYWRKFRASQ